MLGGILIGIAMFMFLVFIHELGHFWTARKAGVKVKEFGIGIPPKIGSVFRDSKGTEWTLNAIPLGGFVRLKGENPHSTDFLDDDSFISASLPWKLIVLAGGVIMNFLFAWLAFSSSFIAGVEPLTIIPESLTKTDAQSYLMPTANFLQENGFLSGEVQEIPVSINGVFPDSLANELGIMTGDIITTVGNTEITNLSIGSILKEYIGKQTNITRSREGQQITKELICPDDQCILGVAIESGGEQEILPIKMDVSQAIKAGFQEIIAQSKLTFSLLGKLGKDLVSFDKDRISDSVNQLSGPVGIVKFGDSIMKQGGVRLYIAFAGMISLALALFNILPIPALDGGRAVGVLIQSIFGLKPEKYFVIESYFNFFFFILLMGLGVYIILLDLVRFRGVNIPGIG